MLTMLSKMMSSRCCWTVKLKPMVLIALTDAICTSSRIYPAAPARGSILIRAVHMLPSLDLGLIAADNVDGVLYLVGVA